MRPHPRPTPRGGNRPHTTARRGRESCSREKERPASGSATKTFIHSHEELGPTAAGTSVPGKRKPVLSTSGDKGPALARRLCVQGTLDKRGAEVLVRRLRSTYSEDAAPTGHRGSPWKAGSFPQAEAPASGDKQKAEWEPPPSKRHLSPAEAQGPAPGPVPRPPARSTSRMVTARVLSQGGPRTESQHTPACTPERPRARARARHAPRCSEDSLANRCRLPRGTDTKIKTKKAHSVSLTRHSAGVGAAVGPGGAACVLGLSAGGPSRPQGPHSAEQ